jgi:hypothetical protein
MSKIPQLKHNYERVWILDARGCGCWKSRSEGVRSRKEQVSVKIRKSSLRSTSLRQDRQVFVKIRKSSSRSESLRQDQKIFVKIDEFSSRSESPRQDQKVFVKTDEFSSRSESPRQDQKVFVKIDKFSSRSDSLRQDQKAFLLIFSGPNLNKSKTLNQFFLASSTIPQTATIPSRFLQLYGKFPFHSHSDNAGPSSE